MILNLNDYVYVELTKSGKQVYRDFYNSKTAPKIYREQLHTLMRIFGHTMNIGFDIPFARCEISFSEDRTNSVKRNY
jgi:hypothetical protein